MSTDTCSEYSQQQPEIETLEKTYGDPWNLVRLFAGRDLSHYVTIHYEVLRKAKSVMLEGDLDKEINWFRFPEISLGALQLFWDWAYSRDIGLVEDYYRPTDLYKFAALIECAPLMDQIIDKVKTRTLKYPPSHAHEIEYCLETLNPESGLRNLILDCTAWNYLLGSDFSIPRIDELLPAELHEEIRARHLALRKCSSSSPPYDNIDDYKSKSTQDIWQRFDKNHPKDIEKSWWSHVRMLR